MTAAGGGRALHGPDAAGPADHDGESRVTPQLAAPRMRMVLGLARVEVSLLVRSVLVLAGLLAGALVIWFLIGSAEPLWWNAGWRIGGGQLVLGMAVLAAAQLNAGRARRDGMADLYASFPATAGMRAFAHLIGLAGAAPASLLLIGAAAVVIQGRGAIGPASIAVLAGGLLLVIAAGAAGIALGARFAHPLAGVLGALALFITAATNHLASGGGIWLLPWEVLQDDLSQLPGPLPGYPPAGAHALTPVPAWVAPAGHLLLAVPVLAVTCWAQLLIMAHTVPPRTVGHPPAVYAVTAQLTGWCAITVACAAWVDRSRYADLGGAVAIPVSFAAIALAWYAPVTSRFLTGPPASALGVTSAWYAIAAAALTLAGAAMTDRWHRYSRHLRVERGF